MLANENRSATTSRRRRFSCFNAATSSVLLEDHAQLLARERLCQVIERAELHRVDRGADRPVRRQHDDREIRLQGLSRASRSMPSFCGIFTSVRTTSMRSA